MTSPLRRKRPTTARCGSTRARTAVSLALAALLPAAAPAQDVRPAAVRTIAVGGVAPAVIGSSSANRSVQSAVHRETPGTGGAAVRRVQFPGDLVGPGRGTDDLASQYQIPIEPPGPERLFRLESEANLMERMRQEALSRTPRERITFPEEPVLAREPYPGRFWDPYVRGVEPYYVCYDRLLFEQKNVERYGWDFGPVTPLLCTTEFLAHAITVPYNFWKDPCRRFECNAGYCLPGDPVPAMLYPPGLSPAGFAAEAVTILGLLAIFP